MSRCEDCESLSGEILIDDLIALRRKLGADLSLRRSLLPQVPYRARSTLTKKRKKFPIHIAKIPSTLLPAMPLKISLNRIRQSFSARGNVTRGKNLLLNFPPHFRVTKHSSL